MHPLADTVMGRAGALGAVVCGLAVAGLALDILVRPVRRASAALVWAGEKPLRVAGWLRA